MKETIVHYSDEFATLVLDHVAAGGTIHALCKDRSDYPHFSTVYKWSLPSCPEEYRPEFAARMEKAEQARLKLVVEQLFQWSDPDNISATLATGTEKGVMPNNAEVQKYDMCSRNRQWLLSRLHSAQFSNAGHNRVKIEGSTAAEKLSSILDLSSRGELSAQAGLLFAQLVKTESDLGEMKDLLARIDEVKAMLAATTAGETTAEKAD